MSIAIVCIQYLFLLIKTGISLPCSSALVNPIIFISSIELPVRV